MRCLAILILTCLALPAFAAGGDYSPAPRKSEPRLSTQGIVILACRGCGCRGNPPNPSLCTKEN